MIAIDLDLDHAEALIADEPGCAIAAVNGPRSLTISGHLLLLARLGDVVRRHGGKAVRLVVSHAFHSPLMEPIVEDFRNELHGLEPQPAQFAVFSTALGRRIEGREMTADYWAADKFARAVLRRAARCGELGGCRLSGRRRPEIWAAHPRPAVWSGGGLAGFVQRPRLRGRGTARRWPPR